MLHFESLGGRASIFEKGFRIIPARVVSTPNGPYALPSQDNRSAIQ